MSFHYLVYKEKNQRKESWEKSITFRKIYFCLPWKKAYEIWEDKNNILYSSKSFRGFFSKFYTEGEKRAPKYFYTTVISQIQLPQSYWKSRASKQTTQLPVRLTAYWLTCYLPNYQGQQTTILYQLWVTKKKKKILVLFFLSQIVPIIHLPSDYPMGKQTMRIIPKWASV